MKYGYKKRLEFAQRIVLVAFVFSALIVVATLTGNFYLLLNDKQPMAQETITTITTFGGVLSGLAFSAYAALTAVRNCSQNKWSTKPNTEGDENAN